MQKTLQFLNAVNGACHSSKTANMILSRKPPNGWDARGATTRQFSFWSLVVVWCNIILHVTFCHAMQYFMSRTPDGNDDRGRVPEQCLDVILWES